MGSFRIIALTPPGTDDPAIAISASRAGEMGVLSLERAVDIASAQRALDGLARHGRGHCGVRLDPASDAFSTLAAVLPPLVRTAILTGGSPERLPEAVATLKAARVGGARRGHLRGRGARGRDRRARTA